MFRQYYVDSDDVIIIIKYSITLWCVTRCDRVKTTTNIEETILEDFLEINERSRIF